MFRKERHKYFPHIPPILSFNVFFAFCACSVEKETLSKQRKWRGEKGCCQQQFIRTVWHSHVSHLFCS